jgi:hypothetical protein
MLSSGQLNGDFFTYEANFFWLIVSFFLSILPYFILWKFLSIKKKSDTISISEIKYFDKIVIVLLLFDIFLSLNYKVGLYAQNQIYQAPFILKPLIVIVNKLDMYVLCGLLLMSKKFSTSIKIIVIVLLVFLSISRASIFVFLFLFLVFIANGQIKFKIKQILILFFVLTITFEFLPKLFEYREVLRKGDDAKNIEIFDNKELNDFIKSKIIGRISSLSSITYFFQNNQHIAETAHQVGQLEYIIEYFRPFYGGIIKENKIGYTYYFTNFYDDTAGVDYGIMYGLPSVMLLAYFKGIHILLLNLILIVFAIYLIVIISSYLFGNNYKQLSFVLLFYPMMSGVPSEFGQILFYLLFISFFKLLYISVLKLDQRV